MTDIFSNFWGRKKRQSVDSAPITDQTFVSYVERDLSDDLNDFVLIDTQQLYPKMPMPYQNQTQFEYSSQQTAHFANYTSTSKMGIGSSANGKSQEITAETIVNYTEVAEVVHENLNQNGVKTDDEIYNVSSFMSGVPFELCSKLNNFLSLKTFKLDGYNYLSRKADMLEELTYNFQLERDVVQATDCAINE